MRKLVIDCGNTLIKLGVFEDNVLVSTLSSYYDNIDNLQAFIASNSFEAAILASVVNLDKALEKKFTNTADEFITLTATTSLPFTTRYSTPATLGTDRLALVAGAVFSYPENDCLIINFGSCVTYNYVKQGAEFVGGAISPGLQMRFKSMNSFTAKLPLARPNAAVAVTGTTTEENLQSGAFMGLIYEVQGFVKYYKQLSAGINVIITGGDCDLISGKLKNNGIFADANLALKGLNLILDHNVKK